MDFSQDDDIILTVLSQDDDIVLTDLSPDDDIVLVKISEDNPTVYVPIASKTVKGIASFEEGEFVVDGGHVQLSSDYAELPDIVKTKVDKSDTAGLHAYTHNGGNDSEVPINVAPVVNTLVRRDARGAIKSVDGILNNEAATIGQLDKKLDKTDVSATIENGKVVRRNSSGRIIVLDAVNGNETVPLGQLEATIDGMLYGPSYNSETHTLTIKQKGKEPFLMDLPLESLISNVETVERDGKWYLVFTFDEDSGHQEVEVPLTALVQDFVKSVNGEVPDSNGDVYVDTTKDPKLYDALLLTDHNGEPLEDQYGRYLLPEYVVDTYAREQIASFMSIDESELDELFA